MLYYTAGKSHRRCHTNILLGTLFASQKMAGRAPLHCTAMCCTIDLLGRRRRAVNGNDPPALTPKSVMTKHTYYYIFANHPF